MSIIKIGLSGASGRMGMAISQSIQKRSNKFKLEAQIDKNYSKSDLLNLCTNSDVIVDFSNPNIIQKLTESAKTHKTRLIVGTTGLTTEHFKYLEDLSQNVAVLYTANTSIGANLTAILAAKSAKILKQYDYDCEIIEAHHKYKKDSPSGTALMIGKKIAKATGVSFKEKAIFDRASKGERKKEEIGFASIRGGGIFGEHEVIFAGDNEIFTVGCKALSRSAFADGALFAASWLSDKKAGLYSMQDVLEL